MTTQTTQSIDQSGDQSAHAPAATSTSWLSLLKNMFNWKLLKETYHEWSRDDAARLAASLAYYLVTALGPLLIGVIAIAGFVYSDDAAREQLVAQANRFIGAQGGEVVQTIVENADQPELARVAGIVSLVLLIWSASSIFVQLQNALNVVWGVELRSDLPLMQKIKRRLLPLLVVVVAGVLLVAAALVGSVLAAMSDVIGSLLPGGAILWQVVNYVITLAVFTLLFGLVFKLLPDVKIAWRDVWPGAALTALLFVVGQLLLGWYLGRQSGASVYGAAGSLIVLLLWIYYSAQIFLFGAEFTQVFATRYGHGVQPDSATVPRGSQDVMKPAAMAASGQQMHTSGHRPTHSVALRTGSPAHSNGSGTAHRYILWQPPARDETLFTLGGLATDLVGDLGALLRLETKLIRTELKEAAMRATRGATLIAGGGMTLYAAVLLVLSCITLALAGLMPAWLAALLVGLLLLAEGWVLLLAGRKRLATLAQAPKQTTAAIAEDMAMVRERITR